MKTLRHLLSCAGLAVMLPFMGEPWRVNEHGANVFPRRDPAGWVLMWTLLGVTTVYWVLIGWWLERWGILHTPQYQDAQGKWHYGKRPK